EASKLEAATFEEKARWGELMPQVDVSMEYGKLGEAFDVQAVEPGLRREFRMSLEINWNAGGNSVGYVFENDTRAPSVSSFAQGAGSETASNTITAGLFDNLSDFVSVKEAEVGKIEQIIKLEEAEKKVVQEVKQSYFDYQKARIQVKSSLQRSAYRQRLARLSKHRLDKNEIQISEYMQSEIDFVKEVATVHRALKDYFSAKASLNHAIGLRDYLPIEERYESTATP
ncbi:MAG: TolC family protein, partial [candidate division Zixibacteria bacterium]|nr:TolC family protein [candidate division Zixibacteria bacterium]